MTPLKFANTVRRYTKQSSTTLTDVQLLLLANIAKDEISELIATRDLKGNYFILPSLDDLTAGQREYAWPSDILDHIYSVEIAFTNTLNSFNEIQYILATPDDFRKWGVSRIEANIQAHYGNGVGRVKYEIQRKAIYILSGGVDATTLGSSTITNGIRLKYRSYPADLSALTDDSTDMSIDPSTTTFGIPRSFHELMARRCSIEWKADHPGAVPLSDLESKYEQHLELKLQGINNPDMSGETIGQIPVNDDHNNNGYDY